MVTAAQVPPPAEPPAEGEGLIAGSFAVDLARPLPEAGGGLAAFAVQDRRSGRRDLMAIAVPPGLPPRARALATLAAPVDGLLAPIAHGPGPRAGGRPDERALYVICPAPPGRSLAAALTPWPEAALLDQVLGPAAQTLRLLAERGLTHRAIRADNVFRAAPGQPAVLGAAWAAPPAMHQPAANEPPYVAMCLPAGRGEGNIADDVYALGVLLLTLATGAPPLPGLDPAGVVRRKLELGSFEALVGEAWLPALLGDLLRSMLAEDPEHRPAPALLADPAAARTRRVAARPPRRAQHPLRIGTVAASGARALAYALATAPEAGLRALRSGAIDLWLRRDLGDTPLSMRLEEALRLRGPDRAEVWRADAGRADGGRGERLLLVRAVATLDPLAPICWPGAAVWPDGVGPALAAMRAAGEPGPTDPAAAAAETGRHLAVLVQAEAAAAWAEARAARADPIVHRAEARRWRAWLQIQGPTGGVRRLLYALNPLLPCASPLLAGRAVNTIAGLLPALNRIATPGPPAGDGPVDADILAFVAAHHDHDGSPGSGAPERADPAAAGPVPPLVQMAMLARLQARYHPAPLPALARWLAAVAAPLAAEWRHLGQRAEVAQRLAALAEAGMIAPMLALLNDPARRLADERGFHAAAQDLVRIDATLAALEADGPQRATLARQWGQELAAGIGLAALAAVLGLAALG
jgi:eukaryotic-like serine/threonine-protein kinase